MRRFLPKSLLGQVMLALTLGLLAAQAFSAVLLYRAAEQRRETMIAHSLAFRILSEQQRSDASALASRRSIELQHSGQFPHRMHQLRRMTEHSSSSPMREGERHYEPAEAALAETLDQFGVPYERLVVVQREAGHDPFIAARPRLRARLGGNDWQHHRIIVAGIKQAGSDKWLVMRMREPPPPRHTTGTILLQTIVILGVLVTLMYLVLRRITRPLAQLTTRLDDFARNPALSQPVPESGPQDIRQLITAHNAMESRIAALIDEKDVMLGAIGHDLKTPLAALRVRIENVSDPDQRARMAETIKDITRTLDDILNLARVGHSRDPLEQTDLAALVASVVEEHEDMGEPVEMQQSHRLALPMRATWLRRALRNLIGNALRYGKCAKVEVLQDNGSAIVRIDDDGPGIPDSQIAAMLEPFARGETSRNRATGGAGLGLTLARAIAEQHGGTLNLSNRAEGGLRAEIRLPIS